MRKHLLGIFAALSLGASTASAQTYDFSSFATEGQNFHNVVVGPMTLSSENGYLRYTGTYDGLYDGGGATSDISLTFSQVVSKLSITAGDGGGDSDAFFLRLYAWGTGMFIGAFSSPVFDNGTGAYYTMTLSGLENVGRVVFDPCGNGICPAQPGDTGGSVISVIDVQLAEPVAVVPEPSTVVLTLSGLLAVGAAARRRRV